MNKKTPALASLILFAALALARAAQAQQPSADRSLIDALPSSDMIVYADAERALAEAGPLLLGRSSQEIRRLTRLDPRAFSRFAAAVNFGGPDGSRSSGVTLFECTLDARGVADLLAAGGSAPKRTTFEGREAFAVRAAATLTQRASGPATRHADIVVTTLAPGLVAAGDRDGLARAVAALETGAGRFPGLEAMPWAGLSRPVLSMVVRLPPQLASPELPQELRGSLPDSALKLLTSIEEVQAAVSLDNGTFDFMLSARADSAQSAAAMLTAVKALGTRIDDARAEETDSQAARRTDEFVRTLQLTQTGDYVTLTGRVTPAMLGSMLDRNAPRPQTKSTAKPRQVSEQ